MSADDDTELRDLLVQTLEKNGTLAKIRAQLRASVFLALEEQEGAKKKAPLLNEKAKRFVDAEDGRVCAEVVAEFLESLNLDATLSVFLSEIQLAQRRSRSALSTALGLSSNLISDKPLLSVVLEADHREGRERNDKDLSSNTKPPATSSALGKSKLASDHSFANGASYRGTKTLGTELEDNSDDDDFFDSAGRANAKLNLLSEKPSGIPATVTVREKNLSLGGLEEKTAKPNLAATSKKEEAKSGSSSLSFLGDLPTLSSKGRAPLPSLTKDKSKDTDFLKLLGDSLDDTDRGSDSSARDSARLVPGLDLKKLDPKIDTKTQKTIQTKDANSGKSNEAAAKVQRKDSSADEEISEEIAEDLEVDDLLDSARSSRQLSF